MTKGQVFVQGDRGNWFVIESIGGLDHFRRFEGFTVGLGGSSKYRKPE